MVSMVAGAARSVNVNCGIAAYRSTFARAGTATAPEPSPSMPAVRRDRRQRAQRLRRARRHHGDTGSITSTGAASGGEHDVNATTPPASRTISCAAATSTARQRRSVTMPSSRAAATWQSETAIAPSAAGGGPSWRAQSADSRTHAGIGRFDPDQLEPLAGAPLGHVRLQRLAVQLRAPTAPGDPLLAGPEVVHEAELDVGHRGALRDRQRERVVRQPALGVARAVERVDHDEQPERARRSRSRRGRAPR